uniref:Uncharacterized protein n=1 Tax=Oryzias sinensis TaxID=183150 RepID=A0A8C7X0S2_9TELE
SPLRTAMNRKKDKGFESPRKSVIVTMELWYSCICLWF